MLDVIIGRYTWNCQIRTHIHTGYTHTRTQGEKKVERLGNKKAERTQKKRGGVRKGKKERRKKRKDKKKRGEKKEKNERKRGGERKKKKREGDGFRGGKAAWVLRRAGPHTNHARTTRMFFRFLSSAKGQTTQTTPLIEAR